MSGNQQPNTWKRAESDDAHKLPRILHIASDLVSVEDPNIAQPTKAVSDSAPSDPPMGPEHPLYGEWLDHFDDPTPQGD